MFDFENRNILEIEAKRWWNTQRGKSFRIVPLIARCFKTRIRLGHPRARSTTNGSLYVETYVQLRRIQLRQLREADYIINDLFRSRSREIRKINLPTTRCPFLFFFSFFLSTVSTINQFTEGRRRLVPPHFSSSIDRPAITRLAEPTIYHARPPKTIEHRSNEYTGQHL